MTVPRAAAGTVIPIVIERPALMALSPTFVIDAEAPSIPAVTPWPASCACFWSLSMSRSAAFVPLPR
jgi:hypothetical protein